MLSGLLCRSPWFLLDFYQQFSQYYICGHDIQDIFHRCDIQENCERPLHQKCWWAQHTSLLSYDHKVLGAVNQSAELASAHSWAVPADDRDKAIRWLQNNSRWQHKMLVSCCYFSGRLSVLRLLLSVIWFVFFSVSLNNDFLSHPTLSLFISCLLSTTCYLPIYLM